MPISSGESVIASSVRPSGRQVQSNRIVAGEARNRHDGGSVPRPARSERLLDADAVRQWFVEEADVAADRSDEFLLRHVLAQQVGTERLEAPAAVGTDEADAGIEVRVTILLVGIAGVERRQHGDGAAGTGAN